MLLEAHFIVVRAEVYDVSQHDWYYGCRAAIDSTGGVGSLSEYVTYRGMLVCNLRLRPGAACGWCAVSYVPIASVYSFSVLYLCFDLFMPVFDVSFVCAFCSMFSIHLLMNIVWLASALYDPTIYRPHKRPDLRDSVAQTLDRELQSAGPPILLTSVDTPLGCRPRGLTTVCCTWNTQSNLVKTKLVYVTAH